MTAALPRMIFSANPVERLATLARHSQPLVPRALRQKLLASGLNRALHRALAQNELVFMHGRKARIQVTDMALDFTVSLQGQSLTVSFVEEMADVTFRAALPDLLRIMAGRVDPDTLFFRRKLMIEGDTALGLDLKNFLDSQDPETLLPKPVFRLLQRLANPTGTP